MKLVAATDIYNSKPYNIKISPFLSDGKTPDPLFQRGNHIHKACRFTIGSTNNPKELSKDELFQVGTLIKYGLAVVDCTESVEKGVIAKIDAEAAAELELRKKQSAKQLSAEELIASAVASAVTKSMVEFQAASKK